MRSGTDIFATEKNKGVCALADLIPYVPTDAGKCSTETIPWNSQPAVRGRAQCIAAKRIVVRIMTDSIRSGADREEDGVRDEMR